MKIRPKLPYKTATYNPLDFIAKENPIAIDLCNSLANALVVRTGEEKDPHFNNSAQDGIAGLTALTAFYGRAGARSLQNVDEILNSPNAFEAALKLMGEPDDTGQYPWDGMLARLGGRMSHWQGDERGSVLSTISRHLSFLRSPAIAAITRTSSFNPEKLVKGKMAIFIVPSLEHGTNLIPWVRMLIDGMMKEVMRCGLQEKNKTHFILDEAASLGQMDGIRDALDKGAGFGIRCQFYYQSVGQLNRCWPNGEAQSLLAQTAQVYFAVNDLETATQISNRIGKATILVQSESWNRGGSSSVSEGHGASGSRGTSWGNTRNENQMGREVLTPSEITTLPPRMAITFPGSGMPAVITTLIKFFEEKWLTKTPTALGAFRDGISVFLRSLFFLIGTCLFAVLLTYIAAEVKTLERLNYLIHTLTKGGRR